MDKLKQFIDKNGCKYRWLAMQLGISPARFYRILEGKLDVTLAEAVRIEDFTKGEICVRDFLPTKQPF